MARSTPSTPLFLVCLIASGALFLAACGDDQGSPETADTPDWSAPAGKTATGSPDGEGGDGVRTAQALLTELRALVSKGRRQADPSFDEHVEAVAAVLWAPDAQGQERAAAQAHMQLSVIAGDVGRYLSLDPPRSGDATEKKIYAAWREAVAGSPDAYRAWCAKEGAALMKEREEALRDMLFK